MTEQSSSEDALFLERLQTTYEKSLSDLRAFAQREGRSYDDVRALMEEMHCKHLFGLDTNATSAADRDYVQNILVHISKLLESLERIVGLQSFFLVVNPFHSTDEGFLGGTVRGRNFWQGHRGCGPTGAKAFKLFSSHSAAASPPNPGGEASSSRAKIGAGQSPNVEAAGGTKPPLRKSAAMNLKTEIYSSMRAAVRVASGIRNAEMKWSNHSQLDSYNVRIVGWPEDIPKANPSVLSMAQNRRLLDGLANRTIHFTLLNPQVTQVVQESPPQVAGSSEEDVFEGTIDFSGGNADDPAEGTLHDTHPVIQGVFDAQDTEGLTSVMVKSDAALVSSDGRGKADLRLLSKKRRREDHDLTDT